MSLPHTNDDTLRIHDLAVMEWLRGLRLDYGTIAGVPRNQFPVLAVMASPSRAFATAVDLLVEQGWLSAQANQTLRDSAESDWSILPLPVVSVQRDVPVYDPELVGVPRTQYRKQIDPITGRWVTHDWPNHYRTQYRATFWCLTRATEAYINEWVVTQFSKLGASNREAFLPVNHRAPWGTMQQSFLFDSAIDLSDLEGTGPRYIRIEYSFRLRTWYMRPPQDGGEVVNVVTPSLAFASRDAEGVLALDQVQVPTVPVSGNLFRNPIDPESMDMWPRWGASEVTEGTCYPGASDPFTLPARSVQATVQADASGVLIAEHLVYRPTTPVNAWAIVLLAFQYRSNADTSVELAQYTDPAVITAAREVALANTLGDWKRFQRFAIVRRNVAQWSISGAGTVTPAILTFTDVDSRQVFDDPAARVAFIAQSSGGGAITYEWAGLASDAYLLVGVLDPASTGAGVVAAVSNILTSVQDEQQSVNPALDIGFVLLSRPYGGSCRLIVPNALVLAAVYALRYAGPYHGHTP